jgi:hypothetical protein
VCHHISNAVYSAVHGSSPVEETEELVDGPTGCRELGVLFAWNFSVTRSTVFQGCGEDSMLVATLVTRS